MFDAFIVRRYAPRVHVELIVEPQLVIEPVPRERAIEGYTATCGLLRRELLQQPNDNQRVGLPTRQLFAPIALGTESATSRGSTVRGAP
jgi:hypothetical protein